MSGGEGVGAVNQGEGREEMVSEEGVGVRWS